MLSAQRLLGVTGPGALQITFLGNTNKGQTGFLWPIQMDWFLGLNPMDIYII